MPDIIENFFGVYLLYCENPKYKGRTYIGYTVDPNRRIKQHNRGNQFGGAKRTSNKGPWTMVMIVHGFMNDISALQFEWAWQHPDSSKRLKHVSKKKPNENLYAFRLRVLAEMLQVGPWRRLPLTIRWLNQNYATTLFKSPPLHMPICYGPVISKKIKSTTSADRNDAPILNCSFCNQQFMGEKGMKCLNSDCDLIAHVICFSRLFLTIGEYVPIDGKCKKCAQTYLWADLVRKYKGCYNTIDFKIDTKDETIYISDSD